MKSSTTSFHFFLIIFCSLLVSSVPVVKSSSNHNSDNDKRCEEITVPMCRNIGYNHTTMPNQFHHETQDEAGLEVHQFFPLVEISCSDDLRFFLCSLYTPICMEDYAGSVPACRSVCERAKQGCEPLMIQYGFSWPEHMDCTKFPPYGDPQTVCMDARMTNGGNHSSSPSAPAVGGSVDHEVDEKFRNRGGLSRKKSHPQTHYTTEPYGSAYPDASAGSGGAGSRPSNSHHHPLKPPTPLDSLNHDHQQIPPLTVSANGCRCDCREPFFVRIRSDHHHHHHLNGGAPYDQQQQLATSAASQLSTAIYSASYFNHSRIETAGGLAPSCAAACNRGPYNFAEADRENGLWWLNVTAIVTVITCSLTFLTYLIDSQRFRYPERAIIFLAACYVCIASGYLLRMRLGHSAIACDGPVIRYQRTGPTPASCLVSFILLYFFGMASAYWWLILTLTWFLAAGLKWGSEAITGYAQYFHLLAWLLPTGQTVVILCLGAIDGDPFAGVCSVGNQSRANLLLFVITPLVVTIAIGSLFLVAGFVALFRIRRAIRQRVEAIRIKTDTLEKLMVKIGLSSFFYIVPEGVVLAVHIYEYLYRPSWEQSLTCICGDQTEQTQISTSSQASLSLILLKYIMSLVIGITSGFWIWSGKTLDSWLAFYSRFACCGSAFRGSPASSRSGATQLLPNMNGYYTGGGGNGGGGLQHGPRGPMMGFGGGGGGGGSALPMKSPNLNQLGGSMNGSNSLNSTPQHLLAAHHHHQQQQLLHHAHLGHHHPHPLGLELQSRQTSLIHPSMPPTLPPPPPPALMAALANSSHHGGSLTGSQFTHLIGSINGGNGNSKVPLSHV